MIDDQSDKLNNQNEENGWLDSLLQIDSFDPLLRAALLTESNHLQQFDFQKHFKLRKLQHTALKLPEDHFKATDELKSFFWVGAQFVDKKHSLLIDYASTSRLHTIQVLFVLNSIMSYPDEMDIPFSKEDRQRAQHIIESIHQQKISTDETEMDDIDPMKMMNRLRQEYRKSLSTR